MSVVYRCRFDNPNHGTYLGGVVQGEKSAIVRSSDYSGGLKACRSMVGNMNIAMRTVRLLIMLTINEGGKLCQVRITLCVL